MLQSYIPPKKVLEKYADLIVEFGMQNREGKRPEKGAVVHFVVPEVAKPLYFYLQRSILQHGYHPMGQFLPSGDGVYNIDADFFRQASPEQRAFHLETFKKALVDQADCVVYVLAETNPHALRSTPAEYILEHRRAQKSSISHKRKKIDADKLNWTIVLYGTDAMAKEAGLTARQYWNQIIKACYLDTANPQREWDRIDRTVQKTAQKLSDLQIESLHVVGPDADLTVGIGADRLWRAGGGNNIPSYEVFTSPNWREVNGWIRLNQPHYTFGKKIEGIELWFKDGEVIKSKATKNHDLLKQMLKTKGGNRLGEFSLTDSRLSRIDKFMAEILYDENTGGKFGNTHIALGASFHECYRGDQSKVGKGGWDKLGFNSSVIHHDIISTTDRIVTATLQNGKSKVIYKDGKFTV